MRNSFLKQFISNVFYASGAQILILSVGILRALILPAFLSVDSFGYWSIYVFYSTYVGLFCFGYNDGLYLRYGDRDYDRLPYLKIRSASRLFSFILGTITILVFLLVSFSFSDVNERFAMQMSSINIFILGINAVTLYVLQVTNRFKLYGFFSSLDKVLLLLSVLLLFLIKEDNWKVLVCMDLAAKLLVLAILVVITKEIWLGRCVSIKYAFKEFWDNVSVGVKLMIANIMGMLLIGLGRIYIQFVFDIDTFSIYSFGISLTGIIITAITSFSLVLYPTLKRLPSENQPTYFASVNTFTRTFGCCSLLLYFPVVLIINYFYAKYSGVLVFLNMLFAISFLQSKVAILNNTYYKLLRKENSMLFANLSTIFLFILFIVFVFFYSDNVLWIPICTFIAFAVRCYCSEYYLGKRLKMKFSNQSVFELIFIICFVCATAFIPKIWYSFAVVFILLMLLLMVERKSILQLIMLFKNAGTKSQSED